MFFFVLAENPNLGRDASMFIDDLKRFIEVIINLKKQSSVFYRLF